MENSTVRIFCEGISDQRFLRDFLKVHYDITVSDKELNDNKLIQNLGSWNKLKIQKEQITETFSEYTSLIFLDADDEKVTDKAGFDATIKFVTGITGNLEMVEI